jgi:hypothetical protein
MLVVAGGGGENALVERRGADHVVDDGLDFVVRDIGLPALRHHRCVRHPQESIAVHHVHPGAQPPRPVGRVTDLRRTGDSRQVAHRAIAHVVLGGGGGERGLSAAQRRGEESCEAKGHAWGSIFVRT